MDVRSIRYYSNMQLSAALTLLILPITALVHAAPVNDMFIPDSTSALNLQADSTYYIDSAFGMDNQALCDSAENLRNNTMGMVQRRLNYQWLQFHTNPEKFTPITGGRAVNQMFKMGWNIYRKQHEHNQQHFLFRYTQGHGKLSNALDYDVRLSGDNFKLSIEYAF